MARRIRLVLLDPAGEPLGALPTFDVEEPWWPEVASLVTVARARFGVDLFVLRLADVEGGKFMQNGFVTYTAEVAGALPARSALEPTPSGLPLGDEPRRAHWARPGGIAAVVEWADGQLEALGTPRTGRVDQTKAWNLSSVLRLPTGDGFVWCKSVPPFMAHEGPLIEWLAHERPALVPRLLAADPVGATVLLGDLGPDEQWGAPEPQRIRMLRELVALQVSAASSVRHLLSLGVPDLGAAQLNHEVEILASRDDVRCELAAPELHALDRLVTELPGLLRELADCGLPETLVHGDFHPGNWIATGDDLALFDWGDSFVGHPMIDSAAFLDDVQPEVKARLLAAWVDVWRGACPDADPGRAVALVPPIAALQRALMYRLFLDEIEPSEHRFHASDVPDWLRIALAARRAQEH